ncbi:PAS domain S-box protein [Tsuneonella sp. HG249]
MHRPHDSETAIRAELLLESVTDYAIYMLDPAGTVRSWNTGARRLKGYEPSEIIGENFSRFYTQDDCSAGAPQTALAAALAEGRFEAEGWRVRKDGSRFWANVVIQAIRDERGDHVGFAKITRDLTERRNAEEALRKSEERFRMLVQGVTDYAIYMLDAAGNVASWNAGAERFKGYSENEIVGEHFSRFYTDEDLAAGIPATALRTAAAEGRFEAEGWRVRKDGTRFWASVVIDRIVNDKGELYGFTKVTRDLTERRNAQIELERSREQFFQSQKMEAIGQLTGGVAHDFNNILAAILSSLRIAQRRISAGREADSFIENAITAAERGATLTQRMLAFARKQELQLETVDLLSAVRDMTQLLQRTIGAGISIRLAFPLQLPPVVADRSQLELAIMNLVVNARDAMPKGGTVTIGACTVEGGEVAEDMVCLSVADEGEGMDQATLTRATEPFFTTKGVGKGTGLGLSMVKGMTEQFGGAFKLISEEGRGTTVEICLRKANEDSPADADQSGTIISPVDRTLRILAVDDDALILLNTVTILEDMGHEVHQASSGKDALEILQRKAIDLMITDYAMPQMNGAELVRRAAAIKPDLKIILASGYADLPHGEELTLPRLSKPYSEKDLNDAIRRLS